MSTKNGDYESNRVYSENCDLIIGHSYQLNCKSGNKNGWHSSFVLIENVAYCEDFKTGGEEIHNITIKGKQLS